MKAIKVNFVFFCIFLFFLIGDISGESTSTDFFVSDWTLDFDACCTPNFLYVDDLNNDKENEIIIGSPTKISLYDNEGKFKWEYKIANINTVLVAEYTKQGEKDIIVGTKEGYVYVLDYTGRVKFRQDFTDWITSFFVSDLDGNGNKELIVGSRDKNVYVLGSDRKIKWKFETGGSVISTTAADIDGDGIKEVLAGSEWSYHDKNLGGIYVLKNGELKWSKQTDGPVSEIYFEGRKIITLVKYRSILTFDKEGNSDWNKENKFTNIEVSDIDNNGNAEIIASSYPYVYVYDLSGNEKWKYSVGSGVTSLCTSDLHNNGLNEVLAGTEYGTTAIKNSELYVISSSGNPEYISKFENRGKINAIVVKDLNRDNKKEVVLAFLRDRVVGDQQITDGSVKVLEINEEYKVREDESLEKEAIKNESDNQKKDENEKIAAQDTKNEKNENTEKNSAINTAGNHENLSDNNAIITIPAILILMILIIIVIVIAAVFLVIKNKGKKSDYKNKENASEHAPVKEIKEESKEKETKKPEEKETQGKTSMVSDKDDKDRSEGPAAKQ